MKDNGSEPILHHLWTLSPPACVLSDRGENTGGGSHVKTESKDLVMQPRAVKDGRSCQKQPECGGGKKGPCSWGTQRIWPASLRFAEMFPTSKLEVVC